MSDLLDNIISRIPKPPQGQPPAPPAVGTPPAPPAPPGGLKPYLEQGDEFKTAMEFWKKQSGAG